MEKYGKIWENMTSRKKSEILNLTKMGGSQKYRGKFLHFWKKFGGSQKYQGKNLHFWKKFGGANFGGTLCKFFQHMFRKFFPDPPLLCTGIRNFSNKHKKQANTNN